MQLAYFVASAFPFTYGQSPLASEQHSCRWQITVPDIYSAKPAEAEGLLVATASYGRTQNTH